MLGRFLVAAITGLVVWLLGTVQTTSETLLNQAKEQLSSRLVSARERVRASGSVFVEVAVGRPKSR